MLLPRVEQEVAETVKHEIKNNPNFMKENIERLRDENPSIAGWLAMFSSHPDFGTEVVMSGLVVYRMLEEQQKVNSN